MSELTKARQSLRLACDRLAECEREKDREIDEVRARHAEPISAARKTISEAKRRVAEAENAAVKDHEWEGQIVVRDRLTYQRFYGRHRKDGEERGMVYTFRNGMDAGPGYRNWSAPTAGAVMVRLLKKDGKPGVKSAPLYTTRTFADEPKVDRWTLEKPND